MFTPTLDWGNELWASLVWIAKGWAIAAICTLAICVLIARYTTWGRQFWRISGAYFTGAESLKVWLWLGGDPAPGDCRRAARGAAQLPGQRHDDRASKWWKRAGSRRSRRRGGEELREERLLLLVVDVLHPGRPLYRAALAGHVHGAAVLPGVARVADRPAHRRLARRQGLLSGPLHRRQDRQPRPAHPKRHRHLHRL